MKTPSNTLFLLINKMTPSEKRYFKRFGLVQQKKDANKYTLLFNAINEQAYYDEAALLQQFEAYDFINNFSEIKKYLFEQIKKALRNYHAQSSVDSILYKHLSDINILFQKELYQECGKIIKKAKKLAQQYEQFNVLLLLNEWKRKVLRISHHITGMQQYLATEILEDQENLALIEHETDYFKESVVITLRLRQKGAIETMKPLVSPRLQEPLTFRAKRYSYLKESMEAYLESDGTRVFEATAKNVDLFESNPHFINAQPKEYIIALGNMLDSCASRLEYNHLFDQYMEKALKTLKKQNFDEEFKGKEKLWIYITQIKAYGYRGCPNELQAVRQTLKQHYALLQACRYKTAGLDVYVQDNLLRSALILEDFSAVLQAYNAFLELNLGTYREDLQMETRLLGLIPHYEMGNWLLLESMVRSALRLLQRKYPHFQLGRLFLEAIKKCVTLQQQENTDAIPPIWRKLKRDALALITKRRLADYILFTGWIDSQLTGGSVIDCVYEVTQLGYQVS
ncbi:MAG: hypothetical protein ACRBFS_02415 [Aureispira sp.]